MAEFFKVPTVMDAEQCASALEKSLQGSEPKAIKDAPGKIQWRLRVVKSAAGQAVAKKFSTRLAQDVSFMVGRNTVKNTELAAAVKALGEKATKDLKKEFDGLQEKSLKEALEAIKKVAKATT